MQITKPRKPKRIARVLCIAVAAFVALEAGLQLASYAAYLRFSRDEVNAGDEGAETILCIGDSYRCRVTLVFG